MSTATDGIPQDFAAFWQSTLAELAHLPPAPEVEEIPLRSHRIRHRLRCSTDVRRPLPHFRLPEYSCRRRALSRPLLPSPLRQRVRPGPAGDIQPPAAGLRDLCHLRAGPATFRPSLCRELSRPVDRRHRRPKGIRLPGHRDRLRSWPGVPGPKSGRRPRPSCRHRYRPGPDNSGALPEGHPPGLHAGYTSPCIGAGRSQPGLSPGGTQRLPAQYPDRRGQVANTLSYYDLRNFAATVEARDFADCGVRRQCLGGDISIHSGELPRSTSRNIQATGTASSVKSGCLNNWAWRSPACRPTGGLDKGNWEY